MSKISKNIRLIIIFVSIAGLLVLTFVRLLKLQIVNGEDYRKQSVSRTVGIQEIAAPRGEIVDVNGNPIVKNHAGFSVVFQQAFFPKEYKDQNAEILEVINILKKQNVAWIDELPVSMTKPYTYIDGKDTDIKKTKTNLRLNDYATPDNVIDKLVSKYEIDEKYTDEEKRQLAGVRYMMFKGQFSVNNDYTFAKDVPTEAAAVIKELAFRLKGVTIIEEAVRVYADGTVMPHVIGTVGPLYAEDYKKLKDKGYKMNDVNGKSGIEKQFESELRGKTGTKQVTVSPDGQNVDVDVVDHAESGHTIKLTIDSKFQKDVQDILADMITRLNQQKSTDPASGVYAQGGAVVVIDVKTGAVKALASYPSYDLNVYTTDYEAIKAIPNDPLVNRALDSKYRPGSTFKPISATALLNEGKIDTSTTFTCHGSMDYKGTEFHCWKLSGHGEQNVTQAIKNSCNIFFYNAIQRTNIDTLVKYEKMFGLGEDPKLEIRASKGYISCPETYENLGITWNPGDLLQSAIGQGQIAITPLQMAEEAMTIANRGVRYHPYLIDSIWDYSQEKCIKKTEPEVASKIDLKSPELMEPIVEGMIQAANIDFGYSDLFPKEKHTLSNLEKPAAVKTGTPQQSTKYDTNSAFIGFYPADNPEIAIAGYIEKGANSKFMVRPILESYYGDKLIVKNAQN